MVRPTQQLHPARVPATPRLAATLLLLRDTPEGLHVLMTRRSERASFAPGAFVFPGGVVDAADAQGHGTLTRRPGQTPEALTVAVAALRESFEELGLLLARHADGRWADARDIAALDRAHRGDEPFAERCAARGLALAADAVVPLARWITDPDMARRFDVPFLMARMPEGQTPVADESEQFEPVWVAPADALARHAAGGFFMIFPTVRTLQWLAAHPTVDTALTACAGEAPLWTSCPRAGVLRGQESRHTEDEPPYGELALVCPDGQPTHALDWQSERPVPLLKNLQRLTAPNPGVMTGPGTNSYLVGDADTGHIAIDPGPADAEHIERIWRAAGGDIRAIVCTHSHPDHSPGAAPLQALCERHGRPRPPILGLPSAATAKAHSHFTPDRALADGERLVLQAAATTSGVPGHAHTLRVVHTPGHAANHLCLLLEEDGLLFSGDHILNGSTTVIDPPDGHMGDYLDSLERLRALCAAEGVGFILPAHGHALHQPLRVIERLVAHRLAREAKVAAALRALPHGQPDDWVPLAYADVPEKLWPVAKRSLLAHVERIRSLGGFNV